MITVESIVAQLTDPLTVLPEVRETLRTLDPEYLEEEVKFLQAAAALEREVGPGAKEFLTALEQEITSDIIFAGWQGFKLNLECFINPVNKLLLREDFEDLHLEHRMSTLPRARAARSTLNAFLDSLPSEKHHLTAGITNYYAYLQTTAYKLAHYFGFCLAEHFLPHVLSEYAADTALTARYSQTLCAFLGFTAPA